MTGEPRERIDTAGLVWDEVADALWLAVHSGGGVPPPAPDPPERGGLTGDPGVREGDGADHPERDPPEGTGPEESETVALYLRRGGATAATTAGPQPAARPVDVVHLIDSRAIVRALRPLMRTVPSRVERALDEEGTAVRAAEEGLWLPELRPARVHPYDLALVIDESASMKVWRGEADAFRRLLERQGAFRDVRVLLLDTDQPGETVALRGDSPHAQRWPPSALTDPTGRRVVFVLTDGVGQAWRDGRVHDVLTRWGRAGPVAVVQVLPSEMWASWSAIDTRMCAWRTPGPLRPSSRWVAEPLDLDVFDEGSDVLPVPVLELDGEWFERWVGLVTAVGVGGLELPGLRAAVGGDPVVGVSADLDPVERVLRFRRIATPTAFRLAVLLAAAPLAIPTMHGVRTVLLPSSEPAHLAEVFLGGLLRPVPESSAEFMAEVAEYDFHKGVRAELLAGGARADTAAVLRLVQELLGDRVQAVGNLDQVLRHPDTAAIPVVSGVEVPLLRLQRDVMQALSGPYARRAVGIDAVLPHVGGTGAIDPEGDETVLGTGRKRTGTGFRVDERADDRERDGGDDVVENDQGSGRSGAAKARPAVQGGIPLRNVNFTGRDEVLDDLHARLNRDEPTAVLPEALHGLGGIGKSQIAVEFVYRHRSEYDLVWWIPAEDVEQIQTAYVNICARIGLRAEAGVDTAVPLVLEALRAGTLYPRWLLVFDNANAPEDVRRYFPQGAGHILITSRDGRWAGVASSLAVDVFTRAESIRLLLRRNPTMAEADADRLAELLGDLPLAVDQAAAWCFETGMTADEYLTLFEDKRTELLSVGPPPTDYPVTVAAAWNLSMDRLSDKFPAAHELLQVCAFFSPEPIARKLLSNVRNIESPEALAEALRDPVLLGRAIREINRYSLAKIDHSTHTIQLHRLVQSVLRSHMTPEVQRRLRHVAQVLLANGDPNQPDDAEYWTRYQELLPHARAARVLDSDDPWVRKLAINVANFLYAWGDPERARDMSAEMVALWRVRLGEDHLDTMIANRWHGRALRALGKYAESSLIARHTLDRLRATLGDDHEETLLTAHGVASDLRARGDFEAARELNRDTYERARRAFGEDDPETLRAANNYALSMRLAGYLQDAKELDDGTCRRRADVLGEDHRFTLITRDNFSVDLRACGDYEASCVLQDETVNRFREVVGPHRALTLTAITNLSISRRKYGDHEGGRVLSDESYRGLLDRFGPRHPDSMSAGMNHSISLRQTGELRAALELGEKVWHLYQVVMGEDHPFTLAGATNLAVTLRLLGEFDRAREVNTHTLSAFRRVLRPDHFFTLTCATNLASDLAVAGRLADAHELDASTLDHSTAALGRDHPSTLAVTVNLALDLQGLGRLDESDEIRRDVVVRFGRVLGAQHPATLDAMNNVRANCDLDPMQI
ncbi:FxSxx-COOH system tetratricopeptide repeat protein [Umezawaea endophytica]|uniref:FxSxx-COOH system tetratricopeptide repeat protein n=1 Tax=Umezawaea endophytica TaxID=1654476 RepID=A0A9X3AIM2_9PSEU|nr:FxSxx-COOH system tetratricopeptide repeat protein [Umezawaea endophytica]MCS7483287.1 FxSxx-COOH system tetratricopeptide repeat protein [Umezawaea endophytica]